MPCDGEAELRNADHKSRFPLYTPPYISIPGGKRNTTCSSAELTKSIPEFTKLTPDSLRGYQTLSNANAKNSLLGEKVRQLISIAVAVTTRCDGCITFHTDAALKAGATKQELAEALGVTMAMNAGAALIYSLRALDSVDAHSQKILSAAYGRSKAV
jgi:AhpD family alkylhydroperoxidase